MPYLTLNFPFTFDIVLQVGIQGIIGCYGDSITYYVAAENMTTPTTVCTSNMKVSLVTMTMFIIVVMTTEPLLDVSPTVGTSQYHWL